MLIKILLTIFYLFYCNYSINSSDLYVHSYTFASKPLSMECNIIGERDTLSRSSMENAIRIYIYIYIYT